MWILLGTVFVASILGSLHCVGMCGPFALLAGNSSNTTTQLGKRTSPFFPTVSYSFGRLTTYALVGIIFGSLGLALNRGTSFAAYQQTATYVAGALMIIVGLVALGRQIGWTIKLPTIAGHLQTFLQAHFQTITRQPPLRRAFLIGAFSCLMPCGWLYTFAIVAAGTGSPLWGALVMVAFWSGTVPIMVALALGIGKLGQAVQQKVPIAMATLVILIGVFTIAFRAPVAIGNDTRVENKTDKLIQQIHEVDQTELPCCHGKDEAHSEP